MTIPLIFVAAGILALIVVVYLFSGTRVKGGNLDDLAAQLRPIDVSAFRNLIDEHEEQFLRASLPWLEFRSIHRERMLAAVDYIRGAARNAGILIRLAEAGMSESDPEIVTAAQSLLDSATRVRMYSFQAVPRFYMSILLPGVNHAPYSLTERYDAMTRQAVTLNCLRPRSHAVAVVS